jgi:regulator of replication initiation timing
MSNLPRHLTLACALALALPVFGADQAPAAPETPPASTATYTTSDDSGGADLRQQLSDMQIKLDAALQSYSLLQDENAKLKADADKEVGPLQTQVRDLSEQVRKLRDQVSDLAAENSRLKAQLALAGPPPSRP